MLSESQSIHELYAAGIRSRLEPRKEIRDHFIVVAGNGDEYREFLKESGVPEKHTTQVRAVSDVRQFQPHPRFNVVYVGHYWDNPVLQDRMSLDWLLLIGRS